MRAVRIIAVVVSLLSIVACEDEGGSLAWRVGFEDSVTKDAAHYLELRVTQGGCGSDDVVYTEVAERMDEVAAVPALESDVYGFRAVAYDDRCQVLGQECQDVELPSGRRELRSLVPSQAPFGGCDPFVQCIDARCDASAPIACEEALLCDDFSGGLVNWRASSISSGDYEPEVLDEWEGRTGVVRVSSPDGLDTTFLSAEVTVEPPANGFLYLRTHVYVFADEGDQLGLLWQGDGIRTGYYYRAADRLSYVQTYVGDERVADEGDFFSEWPFDAWACLQMAVETAPDAEDVLGEVRVEVDGTTVVEERIETVSEPSQLTFTVRDYSLGGTPGFYVDDIVIADTPIPCDP